ncbi:DUF7536 family protein [Halalkalicoccus subterraneus]|uniref:DUF7536 family protein n=1 Tax=Halalkalicoccus subterraneus TaxID=2675002 RepID=UPI000EFC8784|nr:hypothetical protein [Halalkalicoccus subterraneus]
MNEDQHEPSLAGLLLALGVRRNAVIGFAVGVALAVGAYVYRIVLVDAAPGVESSPVLFGALAVTLAMSVGAFVAISLTVAAAVQRARRID